MAGGENCTLAINNYGSITVRARSLAYGFQMVFSESAGRNARAFYLDKITDGGFVLGLIFSNFAKANEFANWIRGYGNKVASVDNANVGPTVRVTIPSRNFDQTGVPTDGIVFGADNVTIAPRMMVQFMGARTLTDVQTAISSVFKNVPDSASLEAQYFYPAGAQLKGGQAGEDWLYDNPHISPVPPSPDTTLPSPGTPAPSDNPSKRFKGVQ